MKQRIPSLDEFANSEINEKMEIQISDNGKKLKLKDLPDFVQAVVDAVERSQFKVSYVWQGYGRYFVGLNALSARVSSINDLLSDMDNGYNFGYDDYYKVLYIDITGKK